MSAFKMKEKCFSYRVMPKKLNFFDLIERIQKLCLIASVEEDLEGRQHADLLFKEQID